MWAVNIMMSGTAEDCNACLCSAPALRCPAAEACMNDIYCMQQYSVSTQTISGVALINTLQVYHFALQYQGHANSHHLASFLLGVLNCFGKFLYSNGYYLYSTHLPSDAQSVSISVYVYHTSYRHLLSSLFMYILQCKTCTQLIESFLVILLRNPNMYTPCAFNFKNHVC